MTVATDISPVHRVAHAALACLRRAGNHETSVALENGATVDIAYAGPALPERLPDAIADYETVRVQPPSWGGTHRLRIKAPLAVLDLAWNPDEAIRILVYCRGDWEDDLLEALA
jgi:hypothetical protein